MPAINLLRAPDIKAAFERAGIAAHFVPSRDMRATYQGSIHPFWRRTRKARTTVGLAIANSAES